MILAATQGHNNNQDPSFQDANLRFDWSQELQGMILSSFYIGYLITHVPGGLLAERIGGKYIIVGALFFSAISSLLTPVAVTFGGAPALIVLRIAMGLFQGGVFPAVSTILSSWVPTNERGFMGSLVFCGLPVQ